MVEVRRQARLGTGMVGWLNSHGYKCAPESLSVQRDFTKRQARTFHDGMRRRFFPLHLQVSDHVRPDRCVRVYFDWDEEHRNAVCAFIGRHP